MPLSCECFCLSVTPAFTSLLPKIAPREIPFFLYTARESIVLQLENNLATFDKIKGTYPMMYQFHFEIHAIVIF